MCSAAVLSNPCASFNPKLCQDLGETELPLTAGAPPKTYFSCPVEAPVYRIPPSPNPAFPLSPANKDSFIICRLISCWPPRRLPGNGGAGSCPLHLSKTLEPQGLRHPPDKGLSQGLGPVLPPSCINRSGRDQGRPEVGGVKSWILTAGEEPALGQAVIQCLNAPTGDTPSCLSN